MITSVLARLRAGGLVAAVVIALFPHGVGATPPRPPSSSPFTDTQPLSYLAARDRLEAGDTASAMGFLRRTLRRNPTHREGLLLYVHLSARRRGADQTLGWIKDHLRKHPSPRLLVGVLEGSIWSAGQRLELLRWGEERGLHHPRLNRMLLRLLLERGRLREGVRRVNSALEVRPRDEELHLLAGRLRMRRGNLGGARDHFREAIQLRPGRPDGYFWLSVVYRKRGYTERARRYRDRFLSLRRAPKDAEDRNGARRSRR